MAGTLALGGVLSGIDYDTLVSGLMQTERAPLYRLQQQQADYTSKKAALSQIESAYTALKTTVNSFRSTDTIRQVNASSTDTDVLAVSASDGALEGSHTVEVNQLASSHRMVHDTGLTYSDSQVGVGGTVSTASNSNTVADSSATWFTTGANGATYTFTFGDETDIEVAFEASTAYSMDDVVALINEASQDVASYDAAEVVDLGGSVYELKLSSRLKGDDAELVVNMTDGDAIAELANGTEWTKTDGTDAAAGAFSYTYNGVTRTLTTTADTTLSELATMINDDGSNPGIRATLVQYNGTYHLNLAGANTGEDYSITINDAETTIDGFDTADFFEAQTAQNAEYRVDGYPAPGSYISSSSNTITNALSGVTLSLNGTGTSTISLTRDTEEITTRAQQLVTRYNNLVETLDLYTGYDEATETGGILQGDSVLNSMLAPITSLVTQVVSGFTSEDGIYFASQIGIEIDKDGLLELDTDVLNDAIDEDYDAVVNFLSATDRGIVSDSNFQFLSALDGSKSGQYEVEATFTDGVLTSARIRKPGSSTWNDAVIDADTNTITGAEDEDEEGIAISVAWDGTMGTHTQSTDLRLQTGIAGAIYEICDSLLDETGGALAMREDSYETGLDDLEDKIDAMEDRLERKEKILTAKFARLEAAMAEYDAISAQYESLFASLSTSTGKDDD